MYGLVNNGTWKKIGEDEKNGKKVYTIKSRSFLEQLILFIACNKIGIIPMIVQHDITELSI